MMVAATAHQKLFDKLPWPVQRLLEGVQIAGAFFALFGWVGSTFSLIAKMQFWDACWAFLMNFALQLPDWVSDVLRWLGAQAHWIAELYRQVFHPIFQWLFQWLPFEVPPIAIDLISIALFGFIGWIRILKLSEDEERPDFEEYPVKFAWSTGILAPMTLVQVVPFVIFVRCSRPVVEILAVVRNRIRPHIGRFWANVIVWGTAGLPFLSSFPISIFAIEGIYLLAT